MILHDGQTTQFNTATDFLPKCAIWNDAKITWHVNVNQALLVNLKIKARLMWWGTCKMPIIVKHFVENDIPGTLNYDFLSFLDGL